MDPTLNWYDPIKSKLRLIYFESTVCVFSYMPIVSIPYIHMNISILPECAAFSASLACAIMDNLSLVKMQ